MAHEDCGNQVVSDYNKNEYPMNETKTEDGELENEKKIVIQNASENPHVDSIRPFDGEDQRSSDKIEVGENGDKGHLLVTWKGKHLRIPCAQENKKELNYYFRQLNIIAYPIVLSDLYDPQLSQALTHATEVSLRLEKGVGGRLGIGYLRLKFKIRPHVELATMALKALPPFGADAYRSGGDIIGDFYEDHGRDYDDKGANEDDKGANEDDKGANENDKGSNEDDKSANMGDKGANLSRRDFTQSGGGVNGGEKSIEADDLEVEGGENNGNHCNENDKSAHNETGVVSERPKDGNESKKGDETVEDGSKKDHDDDNNNNTNNNNNNNQNQKGNEYLGDVISIKAENSGTDMGGSDVGDGTNTMGVQETETPKEREGKKEDVEESGGGGEEERKEHGLKVRKRIINIRQFLDHDLEGDTMKVLRTSLESYKFSFNKLLFVSNLAEGVSEEDILREFESCERVIIPVDNKKNRGHAYVEYSKTQDVRKGLQQFQTSSMKAEEWFVIPIISEMSDYFHLLTESERSSKLDAIRRLEEASSNETNEEKKVCIDKKALQQKRGLVLDNMRRQRLGFYVAPSELFNGILENSLEMTEDAKKTFEKDFSKKRPEAYSSSFPERDPETYSGEHSTRGFPGGIRGTTRISHFRGGWPTYRGMKRTYEEQIKPLMSFPSHPYAYPPSIRYNYPKGSYLNDYAGNQDSQDFHYSRTKYHHRADSPHLRDYPLKHRLYHSRHRSGSRNSRRLSDDDVGGGYSIRKNLSRDPKLAHQIKNLIETFPRDKYMKVNEALGGFKDSGEDRRREYLRRRESGDRRDSRDRRDRKDRRDSSCRKEYTGRERSRYDSYSSGRSGGTRGYEGPQSSKSIRDYDAYEGRHEAPRPSAMYDDHRKRRRLNDDDDSKAYHPPYKSVM